MIPFPSGADAPSVLHHRPAVTWRHGLGEAHSWTRGLLLTWLAWVLLLCTGFGSTLGSAGQALAHPFVAYSQQALRHSASSPGTRAARRDDVRVVESCRLDDPSTTVPFGDAELAPPAGGGTDRVCAASAPWLSAATIEPLLPRQRVAPPSRAPPVLA